MRPLFLFSSLFIIILLSCRRNDVLTDDSLYGQWKTSYGDTITFSKENGKNILTYNQSMNSNPSVDTKNEFNYSGNKLGILDGLNGTEFRTLQSFKWKESGRSFEVRAIEWFLFVNSTNTYFTFTKL